MRGNGFVILILVLIGGVVLLLALNDGGRVAGLSDEDFGRSAYAGIWGLVVAASLFGVFRSNLAGAIKGLLAWGLAFVLLIGLYSYRQELREVGDRMLAELVPGHVITVAGDGSQVRVLRADDAHFHVDAVVNGRTISFLVDTGASLVALDRSSAAAIGIDVETLAFTSRVMTANGMARAAPVRLSYIKIGGIVRENVEAAVMDGDGAGLSLLGMSFLVTLSSFDFRGERLTLTD